MLWVCISAFVLLLMKRSAWLLSSFCISVVSFSQSPRQSKKAISEVKFPATKVDIREHLSVFADSSGKSTYHISVCADVPNNKNPLKVAHHQETGHVFLILQRIGQAGDTLSRVFGFYPRAGLQTLLFKKTKSMIKDNSYREHDVVITKELTQPEFDTVVKRSIELAGKKYHMNKYNCYDYAILIFNAIAGDSPLPLTHIRFPFIFGKGGSPCSVYKDFRKLKESGSVWNKHITFEEMIAPISTGREKKESGKLVANQ
ncbi:MAG: hypothetical protein JNK14_13565 [Chitinophagaceae bacterium]|nr:hypothetical protein [Chitinophagaceae bacterium]